LRRAVAEALDARSRFDAGDYSADPVANRFPEWKAARQDKVSLVGLVEDWWREAKVAGRQVSTYESYRASFERLRVFVKHDDAATITPSDIVRFKDHRVGQGVSIKTVSDSDLAAMRSVFGWAVRNLKLPSNPAADVRMVRATPMRTRAKSLTPEETAAILNHSLRADRGKERPKTYAAKRWVPWLCAYSGARLGEMVQLRKQDLRRDGDGWVLTITPEAGRVKDKEVREVVVHEHLVALGSPAFVEASASGHLFLNSSPGKDSRGVWRSVKNRVTEFVREVVTDPAVRPNHGWRHLFKTLGREAGIEDSVLDAICGHKPQTVGGSYGSVTLKAQREAMAKFPRFMVA
jgi:integrase